MSAAMWDESDADLFGVNQAEAERDRAYAALDATDYRDETKQILRAIVTTSLQRDTFSANDTREHLPADVHSPRIGRAFALAQDMGLVTFAGLVKSTDKGTHGKRINLYRRAS